MRRELISYRIQSASMDVARIAMAEFRRRAKQRWPDDVPKIVNCIHDEVAVECLAGIAHDVMDLLLGIMKDKNLYQRHAMQGRSIDVEIDASAKVAFSDYAEAK